MSDQIISITTPVGRIVSGDVYKPNDKDTEGNPLVIKHGPNAGQPRVEYKIGLAIPKTTATWEETPWGQQILAAARRDFPAMFDLATGQLQPGRKLSFKITDGDSQEYNSNGNRPCDREGFPGHWVMWWANGYAPKCFNANGSAPLTEQIIKRGYYIQINGTVKGNGSSQQPGVFLNLSMIAFSGYGEEIVSGPDASQVGFGEAPLPAGASATPLGGMSTEQPAAPAAAPAAPVQPAHDLVQPGQVAAPPVPPAPPAEESYNVNGTVYTRTQLLNMPGWTEAHLAGLQRV